MKQILIAPIAALMLTACGGGSGSNYDERAMSAPTAPAVSLDQIQDQVRRDGMRPTDTMRVNEYQKSAETPPQTDQPVTEQYIAYRHDLGLTLPKGQVEPMMQTHTAACQAAGTATCIVINSNIYSQDVEYASGNLSIRATPAWIETFMAGVEEDAGDAGGEITQRSTSAEDLTRQIIDTGARLEAQEVLQRRLMELLQRRDGGLSDLLAIERELANVTGNIESIKAQLKTLRLRVSMSSLDLNYQTKRSVNGARDNPLGEAFGDFFYNLTGAIAAVVTAFAVGLPWILLIGLFLWIWLKLIWPRLRGKKKKA